MAGRPTLWGASQILRSYFSKAAEPPPSFWLALVKDIAPSPYMSAEEINEPDPAAGYARVEIPNTVDAWDDLDTGQLQVVSNRSAVQFLSATADWGQIDYWALCDSEVGGNMIFVGDLEP